MRYDNDIVGYYIPPRTNKMSCSIFKKWFLIQEQGVKQRQNVIETFSVKNGLVMVQMIDE